MTLVGNTHTLYRRPLGGKYAHRDVMTKLANTVERMIYLRRTERQPLKETQIDIF
jgi:hypothetical protein